MNKDFSQSIADYFRLLKATIDRIDINQVNELMNLLVDALKQKRQIFIMGNGGSAATASHYVCDFNKGLSFGKQDRFKFICLSDNVPTLMAYGNDISYEDVFVEPLKNYFQKGDLVIGISGSGNSQNVVKALRWANDHEGVTVGLTGYDGGICKQIARYSLHIPVDDMQIAEDLHMVLDHCMMKILYEYLD